MGMYDVDVGHDLLEAEKAKEAEPRALGAEDRFIGRLFAKSRMDPKPRLSDLIAG